MLGVYFSRHTERKVTWYSFRRHTNKKKKTGNEAADLPFEYEPRGSGIEIKTTFWGKSANIPAILCFWKEGKKLSFIFSTAEQYKSLKTCISKTASETQWLPTLRTRKNPHNILMNLWETLNYGGHYSENVPFNFFRKTCYSEVKCDKNNFFAVSNTLSSCCTVWVLLLLINL